MRKIFLSLMVLAVIFSPMRVAAGEGYCSAMSDIVEDSCIANGHPATTCSILALNHYGECMCASPQSPPELPPFCDPFAQ